MTTIVGIFYGLALVALLLVMGMRPERSSLSRFEIERRAKLGKPGAEHVLRRENLLHDVYSLQHVVTALLLVTISALGVLLFHWVAGFLISLFIALEARVVARMRFVWRPANVVYSRLEPKVLRLIERHQGWFKVLRSVASLSGESFILQSKEELKEIVKQADADALSDQERQFITQGLQFDTRQVKEIMTPRDKIDFVKKEEILGPLVLDELFNTGHSRFPVVDGGLDNITGVLHIRSFLKLDKRLSVSAEEAMDPQVYFIRVDQTLSHALAAFLRTRHHLFIVINKDRETVGVLSLEDVIEALLGRKIHDEYEADDNLRAVAERSL